MIKAVRWSILIVGCIGVIAGGNVVAEPFSVIDSFKENVKAVTSLSATVDRVQHFRNARRASAGSLLFDKHYGAVYTWETPGKYRFYRSVFGACGVDVTKQTGWKTTIGTPDPSVAQTIDPLYRFLRIAELPKEKITYRGNHGNTLVFSTPLKLGLRLCVSFDALTARCLVAELLDDDGNVAEKTKFLYTEKNTTSIIPEAMVITRVVGTEVAVDSLRFRRQVCNRSLKKELFTIPQDITWNDNVTLSSTY